MTTFFTSTFCEILLANFPKVHKDKFPKLFLLCLIYKKKFHKCFHIITAILTLYNYNTEGFQE